MRLVNEDGPAIVPMARGTILRLPSWTSLRRTITVRRVAATKLPKAPEVAHRELWIRPRHSARHAAPPAAPADTRPATRGDIV
jgi:hypothetical protein